MAALQAGKHLISDKPLAMTAEEACKLRDAALGARVAHVVTFNYRGNPLIQQARHMIAKGELGGLRFVHGVYLQDWMTDPHVYSWRSDPLKGGVSSALGDIGSHWCDLVEHISGTADGDCPLHCLSGKHLGLIYYRGHTTRGWWNACARRRNGVSGKWNRSSEPLIKLKGKVAIVTGGAAGIGEASCRLFAREGAQIACLDQDQNHRLDPDELESR